MQKKTKNILLGALVSSTAIAIGFKFKDPIIKKTKEILPDFETVSKKIKDVFSTKQEA